MKVIFHNDGGHGWYAVKRKLLEKLGVLEKISGFSYQSKTGKTVYLEEDCDAGLFFNDTDRNPKDMEIVNSYQEVSPIRSYDYFKLEVV